VDGGVALRARRRRSILPQQTFPIMRDILVSQFRAALGMLRVSIANCSEELWYSAEYANRYWHLAYHTVFYADFYLSPGESDFRPRPVYVGGLDFLENADVVEACSRTELLEIIDDIDAHLETRIDAVAFDRQSGFPWLPFSRAELHVYNLRHIQHHAGQLIDRLRNAGLSPGSWIGTGQMAERVRM
jgi:hypothetical protein